MKRTLALLLVLCLTMALFTGCNKSQGDIEGDFLEMIEKPATEENISAISDFLSQYLSKVGKESASSMVLKYEDYILNFDNKAINYKEWLESYEKYISDALKELYDIKTLEQENPIAYDGLMQISWTELAERAYRMEEYISTYKDDKLILEDAEWIYENYITTMVMGTNGTPVFDYKTFEFSQGAKDAYVSLIHQHPDGATTWALKEYFTYLNSINYRMDYNDKVSSKLYFDTCTWLISEAGKRALQ